MWTDPTDDSMVYGSGGAGFNDPNKFDSPGTGKKQGQTKRAQSVTPVVICMLKTCLEDEFTMWGMPTTILKLVCIVRKFDVTSTTVTYELEDHTGGIKAILWLEHDASTDLNIPVDKENIYVKVFGTLRTKGDEKVIMILKISPLDSINEITTHNLDVIHVRVMAEKRAKGEAVAIKSNNPGAELSNSMMSFAKMGDDEDGMSPFQLRVYKCMKENNTEAGVSRSTILKNFSPDQRKEVEAAINFLSSEGHIFATFDADHFQLTNS